jgi:hypothetical protein
MYKNPCFIVGMPRSGTTLLQSILCNTGYFFAIPETHFFSNIAASIPETNITNFQKRNIIEKLSKKSKLKFRRDDFEYLNSKKEIFEEIIDFYNDGEFDTFLEKTPRHVFKYFEIVKYYPDAHFICMIREPRNTVSSILNMSENSKKSVTRMAFFYKAIATQITAISKYQNVKVIRYEDLVDKPQKTLKDICDYLQINFDPKYLLDVTAPINVVNVHEKWKNNNLRYNKIQKNIQNKWKDTLDDGYGNLIVFLTKGNLIDYNYDLSFKWHMLFKGILKDFSNNLNWKEMRKIWTKKI